jgi:hypothetical protein
MEITALFAPVLFSALGIAALNAIFGLIAVDMAKKRGLRPVMAFFAAFFGSFVVLLVLAAMPAPAGAPEEKK